MSRSRAVASTPDAVNGAEVEPRAADGRVPGRRGLATRQRLLDTTLQMLDRAGYRDLKVVDIARRAGTSPATFYQYFPDVEAAVLALAGDVADGGKSELRSFVVDGDWSAAGADDAARALAAGFIEFWHRHRALIRVIDLAALEGDQRFRDLRTRLLNGVYEAIQTLVTRNRGDGVLPDDADPAAVAGVLTSMLSHVAAHVDGFAQWGAPRSALEVTMARIIRTCVTGR